MAPFKFQAMEISNSCSKVVNSGTLNLPNQFSLMIGWLTAPAFKRLAAETFSGICDY